MTDTQLFHGSRLIMESGSTYGFSCCECGLAHTVTAGVHDAQTIAVVISVDEKGTKSRRRGKVIRERIDSLAAITDLRIKKDKAP